MNSPIVFYLGPEGTHSHEAAIKCLGSHGAAAPCHSLYDIFERVSTAAAWKRSLGVVPVENSCEGPVAHTLDMLAAHPEITVTGSFSCPIRQQLLAVPGTSLRSVRRVYSHPQALGQCRNALRRLLPDAELLPETSTAAAAERAAHEPATAAIASLTAAKLYGLAALRKDIQDDKENATRFYVITKRGKAGVRATGLAEARSLMYLVVGNRPGALLHLLAPFDAAGVNLTSIQSRPLPGRPWEYAFFIEAATDWKAPAAKAAWNLAMALAESGRIIGTYSDRRLI